MSDMEQSDVVASEADAAPVEAAAPAPVVVVASQPSSASPTQAPEAAPAVVEEPMSLEDAARVLLIYVKAHRTAGDSDLEAAVADVEAALSAQAA